MTSNYTQRGFFGIIIPRNVLEEQELNITEKFIYGYIASFTRCCFESNDAIATKLGVSSSTVAHTIPKLESMGYLFVEKDENNRNRKIYSVLDNPKKLAYLNRKGMFKDVENHVENSQSVVQNMHCVVQNMHDKTTTCSSAKFAHIEKEENKNKVKVEQKPNNACGVLAGQEPATTLAKPRPKRSDFDTDEEYEKAIYKFME